MRTLTFLVILVFLVACNTGLQSYEPRSSYQSTSRSTAMSDMPNEPGKCYAKGIKPNEVDISNDTLGVFAIDETIPPHMLGEVEYQPASTKWVKKKADKNCLSADPNDCLVWCLQTIPAVYGSPSVIVDSSGVQPMKIVVVPDKGSMLEAGGYTTWVEVLCDKDLTVGLLRQVHAALKSKGYDSGVSPKNKSLSEKFKAALKKFQVDNYLVSGQLSVETLESLDVMY